VGQTEGAADAQKGAKERGGRIRRGLELPRRECGVRQLEAGAPLKGGAWRPRTTATYTPHCPYLQSKVRYNCVNKSTTANDFEFQFSPSRCSVRNISTSMHMLAGGHLHLCGDSHARQVFLEILCSNVGRIRQFNGAPAPDPAGRPRLVPDNSHECNTTRHYYPPNYWGGDPPKGRCWAGPRLEPPYEHGNHFLDIAELDNKLTISFMFLREAGHPNPAKMAASCLSAGVRAAGPRGQPSVICYNAYVDEPAMLLELDRARYTSRAIAIAKWDQGLQSTRGPTCPAKHTLNRLGERTKNSTEAPQKCTGRYPLDLSLKSFTASVATVTAAHQQDSHGFQLVSLYPVTHALTNSRIDDAKASMYPIMFKKDGVDVVCHKDRFSWDKTSRDLCGNAWHTCTHDCVTPEGHFCMPGPVDVIAQLILHAASQGN